MSTTTLLLIILVIILFSAGGLGYRADWPRQYYGGSWVLGLVLLGILIVLLLR